MRKLKTFNLFEMIESKSYDIGIIKDMLLDYSDNDINVNTNSGSFFIQKDDVNYFKIDIRNSVSFKIEECLFDVIDYLEDCGLFLVKEKSWYWNDMWQYYIGCPNCLSEDIEDNYNLTMKTVCHRCHYTAPADSFLVDSWPVDKSILEESMKDGKLIYQLQLTFTDRKSLY